MFIRLSLFSSIAFWLLLAIGLFGFTLGGWSLTLSKPPQPGLVTQNLVYSPNFAEQYYIEVEGCGTQCWSVNLYDAVSGERLPYGLSSSCGAGFELDSPVLSLTECDGEFKTLRVERYVMFEGALWQAIEPTR